MTAAIREIIRINTTVFVKVIVVRISNTYFHQIYNIHITANIQVTSTPIKSIIKLYRLMLKPSILSVTPNTKVIV